MSSSIVRSAVFTGALRHLGHLHPLHYLGAVVLALAVLPTSALAIVPIALAGDPAPGTGGGVFSLPFQADVNEIGEVSFFATVTGGTAGQGLFVGDGTSTRAVAVTGDAGPGGVGLYIGFSAAMVEVDDDGDVGFFANLAGGPALSGLFLEDGPSVVPIALLGEAAPGTAGTYAGFAGLSLNNEGEIAFVGVVAAFPPVAGVFVESASSGRLVVEVGDTVPGVPGASFDAFGDPVMNDDGEVAFTAEIVGPGFAASGVWVYSPAGVGTLIVLEDDVAPGTGGLTFDAFDTGARSIDSTGNVYTEAEFTDPSISQGLYVGSDTTLTPLSLQGDPLAFTGGGEIDAFLGGPDAAPAGDIAFIADLSAGTVDEGVFFDAAPWGSPVPVAREGDPAPETGGGTFASFSGRAIPNDAGDVAFLAGVAGGTTLLGIFIPEPSFGTGLAIGALVLGRGARARRSDPSGRSARPAA